MEAVPARWHLRSAAKTAKRSRKLSSCRLPSPYYPKKAVYGFTFLYRTTKIGPGRELSGAVVKQRFPPLRQIVANFSTGT